MLLSVGFSRVPVGTPVDRRLIPMWRIFRDARILGAIGLGLFLGVIAILNATVYSPEATVMRYLTALEDGRQADAVSIVWGDSVSLIYDLRVPADPADRPHSIRVTKVTHSGDSSIVLVAYELGGVTRATTFGMRKEASWAPLSDWRFAVAPIATIALDSKPTTPFGVNGSLANENGQAFVPSVAQVGSGTNWFDAAPVSVVATDPAAVYFTSVTFTPSTALHQDIDAAVREYIDHCAAQKTLVPKKCPFAGFTAMAIADGPTWTIDTYPTVSIVEKDGQWHVSGDGKVRLKVSLIDFATEKTEKYSEKMSFTISATLLITDGAKPRLVFDNTVER